jgi:hypothetical protein
MFKAIQQWLWEKTTAWLNTERDRGDMPLCDFERLSYEIRPCDVLLVEGRTRVSDVIKLITQSTWTHAALYIGRLHDIDSPAMRDRVAKFYKGDPSAQLVIEALLGKGTIVVPLSHYRDFNLRICRPSWITRQDAQQVINAAIARLGNDYDVRQMLDLARYLLPYGILPREWRTTLFRHNAGKPTTRYICSTMLVEAFQVVHYPVLPHMQSESGGKTKFLRRNPRLYTPSDFDYSPYFDIIKYPFMGDEDLAAYRWLPWGGDDARNHRPSPPEGENPSSRP